MMPDRSPRPARLLRLGAIDYLQGWALQRRLVEEVRAGGLEALVLCFHPPTVTLGRGATEDQLRVPRPQLEASGVRVVDTDRGGGATVHSPGQLVGYPILKLGPSPDLHRLLRSLEAALIAALGMLGVPADRREGLTGVWVGEEKIASIGMRFQGGVTLHGFALNVDNDLDLFEAVVPCGLEGVRLTSVARQSVGDVPPARVESSVIWAVEEEFGLRFEEVAPPPRMPAGAPEARAEGARPSGLRPRGYGLQ